MSITNLSYFLRLCTFELSIQNRKDKEKIMNFVDPCESTNFSLYANVKGDVYPCSFIEGIPGWETGLSLLEADNFNDIWSHPRIEEFRCELKSSCRNCPKFSI